MTAPPITTGLLATRYSFTLRCTSTVRLAEFPGFTLYGAIKTRLGARACLETPRCEQGTCAYPASCAYGRVFAPVADDPTQGKDPPRPFVLHLDDPTRTIYEAGDRLLFEIRLVGRDAALGVPVALAVRDLAQQGLGVGKRGAVEVVAVEACTLEGLVSLWAGAGQPFHPAPPPAPLELLAPVVPEAPTVGLEFQTPLRLFHDRRWLNPETFRFSPFVSSLAERVNALAQRYGDGEANLDAGALARAAAGVLVTQRSFALERHRRHGAPMDGITGRMVLRELPSELHQLLTLGAFLHAGSKTTMGLGQLRLVSLP